MKQAIILLCSVLTLLNVNAQNSDGKNILSRPLKNINYMSVNARLGLGFSVPTMEKNNNWSVNPALVQYFGFGYNFVIKNSWGFDIQVNEELGSFLVTNDGPSFKTSYAMTGAELGVKKILAKKPDDTFFIRAAFGYNFLINAKKSAQDDFYSYSTSASGSNMYVLPEFGYQLRLPSGRHIFDFSVNYKYSLSDVAATNVIFTDKGNAFETNTVKMNGSNFGGNIRYSFLFKGFEKKGTPNIKVDSHF